jgi:hypothetical protein
VAWTFTAFSVLLTIGRLIIRYQKSRRLRVDDILNAVAATFVIPFIVLCSQSLPIQYKAQMQFLGRTTEGPTSEEIQYTVHLELAELLLLWTILYFVKASFLALYWQIFAVSTRFRVMWWSTAIFIAISWAATFISSFWHCGSPSKALDTSAFSSMFRQHLA